MAREKLPYTKGHVIAVVGQVEHESEKVADLCSCYPDSMGQGHLGRTDAETSGNARRIAASWRAMAGIPTLRIERLNVKAIISDRDLLLRSLQELLTTVDERHHARTPAEVREGRLTAAAENARWLIHDIKRG